MCMFFILQVSQYFSIKIIFMIKSVILWETVENKVCFTKTGASNALGKESSQSCLWTKSQIDMVIKLGLSLSLQKA